MHCELRKGGQSLGAALEFGQRTLGNVARGLCWLPFGILAEISLGISFGYWEVFLGMAAGTESEHVLGADVTMVGIKHMLSVLMNVHTSRGLA